MESRPIRTRVYDDGIDRWEMVEAAPAARLAGRVSRYTAYREETGSFSSRRELAATSGVLIYVLDEPLEITGADGSIIIVHAGEAFAGAIADGTSLSRNLGRQSGVHVFMPLSSLATVTGAPLSTLANCVAPLRDLIGPAAEDLGAALFDAPDARTRFDLLDRFLIRRFEEEDGGDRAVAWSMRRLATAAGPSIRAIAAEIGWSRRHLTRRFRAATGFTPDRFRRIARFERFAAAIMRQPGDSLAGLAAECGYVDQAHLTRDVRDFSAMTPGELRARLIPGEAGVRHD